MEKLVYTVTFWDKETNEWKGSTTGFESKNEAKSYANRKSCYNATIVKEIFNDWDEDENYN